MTPELYTRRPLQEQLNIPERFPFPYVPEHFSAEEQAVLRRFFTNTDRPVFAIHGLPQEVVGAMFSRYSRTEKSVRRVFLDEFWKSPEAGIAAIAAHLEESQEVSGEAARERALKFYKTVHAQFGDESIIQMGSVHIAFEGVSQIAAKAIEDNRIGAAYIEKSTRYVNFGSQANGHYLYMEEPDIMGSEFAADYLRWNDAAFDAYNRHLPAVIEFVRQKYPLKDQTFVNPKTGVSINFDAIVDETERDKARRAYDRALKAKAFDIVRVFLPTTTVTNLGAHFSGQSAENAVNKMMASDHPEVRTIGFMAYEELMQVAPSFFQNVDHDHGDVARSYLREARQQAQSVANRFVPNIPERAVRGSVRLVDWDRDADLHIAAQYMYSMEAGRPQRSLAAVYDWARRLKESELSEDPNLRWSPTLSVQVIAASLPDRGSDGRSRRQKLPRAFEHADAEVEFYTDFGAYRDLQRNRMSTTERLPLTAEEVSTPQEFKQPGMEEVLADYERLAQWTEKLNTALVQSDDPKLREAAEYVTLFGNKIRFSVRANIRQWVFFSELRTVDGGHPSYRRALQIATKQIGIAMPFLRHMFTHTNWQTEEEIGLGRLRAEIKTENKLAD